MIDLGHVSAIRQRISEIQQQMGFPQEVPGMDFAERLQKEMEKAQPAAAMAGQSPAGNPAGTSQTAPSRDIQTVSGDGKGSSVNVDSLAHFMEEAARRYQVDPRLVSAVAEVESNNDQTAVSGAGAIGVMQLMPDTAASLGVDPYDAKENIEGGVKYLRQMLDSFGGDVRKAVAAYNAGPQAVRDYNGVPPYRETQDYVSKVLDIYR